MHDEFYHSGVKGMKWGKRKTDSQMADEVIRGNYGNGQKRVKELTKEGYNYDKVQKLVNEKLKNGQDSKTNSNDKTSKIVDQVIRGKFGNGKKRVKELKKAGYDYSKIQKLVNQKLKNK